MFESLLLKFKPWIPNVSLVLRT